MKKNLVMVAVSGPKIDLADELEEEFAAEVKAAMTEAGQILTDEVRRLLRLRVGTQATVSPEGEPPERDTGDLVRGVRRLPTRVRGRFATSGVQVRDDGAARLEHGATDRLGRRTLPHPFLAPALAATEPEIDALLTARLGG